MEEAKTPPPRIASRNAVMAAVAVLIVIAIAGIVLASLRRTGAPGVAGPDSTQASAAALTGGGAAAAADDSPANVVVFAPASDQLSPLALAKIAVLADKAKKEGRSVVVATKIEANAERAQNMDLAKRRAFNVRSALTSG